MATVNILITSRNNTDTGFARVRTAMRNLRQSMNDNFAAGGHNAGHSFSTRLRAAMTQGLRSVGEIASGLGQSLGRAFSVAGSNPYVMAGIAALVATVAPAIGAALAGAITLAFGGAFIGLGVYLLKELPEVKAAWSKTIGGLRKQFEEAAKPLLPVIQHALTGLQKMGDKFAPHFKKAMEEAAPHLKDFLDRMGRGIELFGKKAFKPMMDAFNDLLDNIDLESFFGSLGDSFKYLGEVVSRNKREIGLLINIILGSIPLAIRIIAFLADTFGHQVRMIMRGVEAIKVFIGWVKKIAPKVVKIGQKGAEAAAKAVVGVINTIKRYAGKVVNIAQRGASTARNAVQGVINTIRRFIGKTVSIGQRGAQAARQAVQNIINTIRRFIGKTVSVGVRGASAAVAAVQRVINRIRNFVGKTVSIGVNFFKGAGSKLASALGFAHGGIVGRAAEGGPRSNTTMVGENGPELVDLAPGSRVRSNPDTRRLLSKSGGSDGNKVFVINIAGRNVAELLWDDFRKEVRVRGGDVQVALGR